MSWAEYWSGLHRDLSFAGRHWKLIVILSLIAALVIMFLLPAPPDNKPIPIPVPMQLFGQIAAPGIIPAQIPVGTP